MGELCFIAIQSDFLPDLADVQPIISYKLASKNENWHYWPLYRFIIENKNLSSNDKELFGYFAFKIGKIGYYEATLQQISIDLQWSLSMVRRSKKILQSAGYILSVQRGNGESNIYFLRTHPDMGLTPEQIKEHHPQLPRHIQQVFDRAMKRSQKRRSADQPPSAPPQPECSDLSSRTPPDCSILNTPKEIKDHVK